MDDAFDVAIAGCGITGMALARHYLDEGRSVVLVDDYAHPGGNHISQTFDGLEFDIGAIYFHAPDLQFTLFPELSSQVVPRRVRLQKVNAKGRISAYPFSMREDLPGWRLAALPISILEAWGRQMFIGTGPNVDTWVRSRVGSLVYAESGLAHYIERLSGCGPTELDLDFADSRLGLIKRRSTVRTQIRRLLKRDRSITMQGKSLVRAPGGFAAFYAPVVERLRADGAEVILDAGLTGFTKTASGTRLLSGRFGEIPARRLISTLPFAKSAALGDVDIPDMPHVTLISLYVEADNALGAHGEIIYNFDHTGSWKRLTLHSRFYNDGTERTGFTVEVPVAHDDAAMSPLNCFKAFQEHATARGLVKGSLRLLGTSTLPFAYPILKTGYGALKKTIMDRLEDAGIEGAGRHGAMTYLPSSSSAIKAAQVFADGTQTLPRDHGPKK